MNTTARQIRRLIASNESYYAPIVEQARKECKLLCDSFAMFYYKSCITAQFIH